MGSFDVYHKPLVGTKFSKIFGFKDMNVCQMTQILSNPMFKTLVVFANETLLKGLVRTCPYGAGWYRIENASFVVESLKKLESMQHFPNGNYKFAGKLFNKKDDNILSGSINWITHYRQNTLAGDELF